MKSHLKFFKKKKFLPVDKFFRNVLYDKKIGYYSSKLPFGKNGDFITAPGISNLFSEMISVWIIAAWENLGKPKQINIVELGPGDGSLTKILVKISKKFPQFDLAKQIYLYEKSNFLKKIQKKNINNSNIKWVNDFKKIKNGPIIFFGNEFFDAIPIKQFKRKKNLLFEKYYTYKENFKIIDTYKEADKEDIKIVNSYKTLKKLEFIEFPKLGLRELKNVINVIKRLNGCILIIDYGYIFSNNLDTLQSVIKHKKNNLLNNLGKADVTSHVNFSLLNEFFVKNNLKVKEVISQKKFLSKLGIIKRAEIIANNMNFKDKTNLYLRLKRLLSPGLMGNLFKVILAYKFKKSNFFGFN